MTFKYMLFGFTMIGLTCWTQYSEAAVLTNGALTVVIRDDNGAIGSATFGGAEFFRKGTFVSDYGFQSGTDVTTYVRNDAYGGIGQPVTVTGTTVSGTFTRGGANVEFTRQYSLVPGLNVLRVTTEFTNNGSDVTLSYFDTFDPDQGVDLGLGYSTFNDVFDLSGGTVGQARVFGGVNQHTVLVGSLDARATVAAGYPFVIGSGGDVNSFFASPFDGNDTLADQGIHVGIRTSLASGQTTLFTYDLAFGLDPASAQAAFSHANASAVPEPSSLVAFSGLGACLLVAMAIIGRSSTARDNG